VPQVGQLEKQVPGGSGVNPYAQAIEDVEGLDKIENLQVREWRLDKRMQYYSSTVSVTLIVS
jgi:hypothetical protein